MSRVYFHSPSGEVELSGRERAYAGWIIGEMAFGVLRSDAEDRPDKPSLLRSILPPDCYLSSVTRDFQRAFQTWFSHGFDGSLIVNGKRVDTFTLILNTALVAGSDAIKLLARIHGQCEIHAWVDGANRSWLAEIAEIGLEASVLRADEGWEKVIPFLRSSSSEPVVLSYSVTDQFPNAYVAEWHDEHDGDDWYDIPVDKRWEMAMSKLRDQGHRLLEMKPETWGSMLFGGGESAFTVAKQLANLRATTPQS